MNKANTEEIVKTLTERLRELPDGTRVSTARLMRLCGYETERFECPELLGVHYALLKTAKKTGPVLDMSAHRNREEGLPYLLDFTVRK